MDILDWLGMFFGFQNDNVRNQREHLVLHLANSQMRLSPPPKTVGSLDPTVLRDFRSKLLKNYTSWCSYLGRKSQLWLSNRRDALRRELLYVSLYLLIWGESANLRFCPECICYIFHHMALELNQILENYIDDNTGRPFEPSYGANGFLIRVVTPIYNIIKFEVDSSQNGTKPHSAWRNYDDINEFFWSRKCFRRLGWPINRGPKFFETDKTKKVGKTGFVEQRSFWNVFRSFDRLWVLLILSLQAFVIVAWQGTEYPWKALKNRGVQVKLLTVFITWGALRFLQSVLDAGTQYSLVSRETRSLGVRMVLKSVVAITWTVVFGVFYGRIWSQKNSDGMWSDAANRRIITFLEAAFVFIIPELLALTLFMIPWVRICLEETNWKVLYCLTWWFHTRTFVGRGLREGPVTNMKYSLFWIAVLASKFSFSYFLQIKPLIAPTKILLSRTVLTYTWHEFFGKANRTAIVVLWVPVLLIYLMDLQIWYAIFSSLFNLMPEEQTENTKLFALIWNEIILTFREEDLITYDSIRSLLLLVVKSGSEENSIVANFFQEIERDSMHNVPTNLEARRRIAFFSNSLFMNMPHAPRVEKMVPFSILTPYYNEEVMYGQGTLRNENEDGISTLFYLQKIYADEWANFMERMHRDGMEDDNEIWSTKARDLRLWASYRGQTLSRTVRGMMYYYRALKMLTFLDSASEMDIRNGSQQLASHGHEYGSALMKFTYVVACQIYGSQKMKGDPRAEEILFLMKNNEALRVAYVDEVPSGREEVEYYSVLVKYDDELQKEVEIYRIRLPGPLKIGEGKPENQNHAIIFTRGDALQTIDMNQDNYYEEALKMRNLLEEFKTYYGIRKPTILGVRENVITGSVSSLAWFMSAQEMSFVTLGQRVLANPLKVRMHYGHPDVFDRFWFLTRGGISKASRVINISEDIFAGFNCTLRGGNVTHHEYIQVGKGRDVGLNQISMFEAKVASGNGEQVLSRDVYRLGHRLDFFRMLSFFYSTVGFYFNTMVVVLTVYTFLWGRLYLALSGVEGSTTNSSTNNRALGAVLNQQFIIQLGLFSALPMVVENTLEHGFLSAVYDFLTMQLQLASIFYTFSMGTRTHFFGRTILHGGAKYRATGRGFVVEHKIPWLRILWFTYSWQSQVGSFGGILAKAEQSWETWWYEEHDHLRTTGLWGKLLEMILDIRFFFFQYGVVYRLKITTYARDKYSATQHIYYRLVQLLVIVVIVLVIVLFLKFTNLIFLDLITSLLAFIPTGWGLISIAVSMQTRILFNEAFSRGLQISRILTGKKNIDM
ncbi:unnamed protein product, partial [Vitis vinifera]